MEIVTRRNGKLLIMLGLLSIPAGFTGVGVSASRELDMVFTALLVFGPFLAMFGIPIFIISTRRLPSKLMFVLRRNRRMKISSVAQELAIGEQDVERIVSKLMSGGEPIQIDYSTSEVNYNPQLSSPAIETKIPVSAAQAKETVVAEVKAPVRYCVNCGTEMLADALYCPTCAAGTLSPASDRMLGPERLEHAAIQASVIVRHVEVKIGEDATIELQMINAGKKPATLVKIENVVPAGFELVSGPKPYRVVGDDLHLKGRRLDPMKTEEIELVLRPKRKGSFLLKLRIFYLDEDGNYRYHDPDPVTITVKEIGLRGWVTGPE
jgi:hypothetical protein